MATANRWTGFVFSILLPTCIPATSAQDYPTKPIRAMVPAAPGGGTDVAARPVAQKLAERLGQQVIIDNRGGANGNIGLAIAARAAPDGYTLLFASNAPMAINPALYANVPYDPVRDFAPVAMIKQSYFLLVIHPSVAANSVRELIQLAKGGNRLVQASSGIGSAAHLSGEILKNRAKIDFVHVPYRGGGPAMAAVIAGEASFMFVEVIVGMPFINAGKLKLLAVATPQRIAALPDTPTLTEASFPGYDPTGWAALFVPTGTPRSIIDKLNAQVKAILKLPDVQKVLANDGTEFGQNTPDYVSEFLKSEIAKWGNAVKISGVRAE